MVEVFQDKELQSLFGRLSVNFDVRIAASRVLQVRRNLDRARPTNIPPEWRRNIVSIRNPEAGPIPAYSLTNGELTASARGILISG